MKSLSNIFTKTLAFFFIAILFSAQVATASNGGDSTKANAKEPVKTEDTFLAEVLDEVENEEIATFLPVTKANFEVYDKDDNLIFSGSEKIWKALNSKQEINLKRSAEFMFTVGGTQVYKLF